MYSSNVYLLLSHWVFGNRAVCNDYEFSLTKNHHVTMGFNGSVKAAQYKQAKTT